MPATTQTEYDLEMSPALHRRQHGSVPRRQVRRRTRRTRVPTSAARCPSTRTTTLFPSCCCRRGCVTRKVAAADHGGGLQRLSTDATTMLPAMLQRTAESCFAAPAHLHPPRRDLLFPSRAGTHVRGGEDHCRADALGGESLPWIDLDGIWLPIVSMIRHPPRRSRRRSPSRSSDDDPLSPHRRRPSRWSAGHQRERDAPHCLLRASVPCRAQ